MEHTVEVFYVLAEQAGNPGVKMELAKFFELKHAENHAADLQHAKGHSDVSVESRTERMADQLPGHRPDHS
jgi:hypothetical protein